MSRENVRVRHDCENDFRSCGRDGDLDRRRNRAARIFFRGIGFQSALVVVAVFRAARAVMMSRPGMIRLNLPRAYSGLNPNEPAPPRESLCTSCALAHIVRATSAGEEVVMCGYAFPPRAVLFAVRECTDHKLKRERSSAEIASEGAVSCPPLEVQAASFRVAVAAREACGE
jgi:hypothetical protein